MNKWDIYLIFGRKNLTNQYSGSNIVWFQLLSEFNQKYMTSKDIDKIILLIYLWIVNYKFSVRQRKEEIHEYLEFAQELKFELILNFDDTAHRIKN